MNCRELSEMTFKTAVCLDPDIIKSSSAKYPKDLGSWGLDESKLEELIRHLKKLKVEIKIFDLNEDEFPKFKGESLVELELRSDNANSRKVKDVLKRVKAFPLEEHHIINVRRKPKRQEEFLDPNKKKNKKVC